VTSKAGRYCKAVNCAAGSTPPQCHAFTYLVHNYLHLFCVTLYFSIPQDGLTALIYAVREGHTETVNLLMEAGADVNLQEEVREPN